MKKSDVKIDATYLVKVSGSLVPVKILGEHPNGGWEGKSLKTGKTIRIKSAQRLRKPLPDAASAVEKWRNDPAPTTFPGTAASDTKAKTRRHTGQRDATGGDTAARPASLIDAAATLLAEAGEPMGCKELANRAEGRGLWSPSRGGKTPDRTLYSAILREIKVKGEESRFEKVERGKFAIRA